MLITYQYPALNRDGRLTLEREKIDAARWLDYLQANTERYGNLHEFVSAGLAAIPAGDPLIAASIATQIDETFRQNEPTVVFQFVMHCWHLFKQGMLPAGAWAAALATGWQSGERAMLDNVPLPEALVVEMFAAADPEALFRAGASRQDWAAYYAGLPEKIDVYRGVTTALKHQDKGLSWTTSAEQAKQFSGRNVRQAAEIPGVIHAQVPKSALLAVFDVADEVVLNPAIAKENLSTNYLSGSGLTKFRQNWKKWKAEEAKRLQEASKAL